VRRHVRLDPSCERGADRRRASGGSEHPLLRLQRSAGNHAVTAVVQRDKAGRAPNDEEMATYFANKVSMAVPLLNYKGKTNATFDNVNVERHWEWGLLADDIAIVFQCGPQRFRFETTRTGGENFPWRLLNAKGGSGGWVLDPIEKALGTLYSHWKDPKRFGPATRVVIDALQHDVEKFREREAEYRKKQAAGMGAGLGSGTGRTGGAGWWEKYRDSAR
jgi:hypothetical protein